MANALSKLLAGRHIRQYGEFAVEYRKCAARLDPVNPVPVPSRQQYYTWINGKLGGLPRDSHCRVLEAMFPGWTAQQLFASSSGDRLPSDASLGVGNLVGWWLTAYAAEGVGRHVDLTQLSASTGRHIVGLNHIPRSEFGPGYVNEIDAELRGRHVIGTWRDLDNFSYYFGTLHLAMLPGESIMEGYYTGFDNDISIMVDRWRWVRLADNVDKPENYVLRDPVTLYALVSGRNRLAPALTLTDITEDSS